MSSDPDVRSLDIPLERDVFLRDALRVLTGALQDIVGVEEASGFVSIVGQSLGERIDAMYRRALGVETLSRQQVTAALVDLKRRIRGDFRVVAEDARSITMESTTCPFGDRVAGRPSLCMMTSNVFGTLVAENLGYARVILDETIADGHGRCRIRVYLDDHSGAGGREYFKS